MGKLLDQINATTPYALTAQALSKASNPQPETTMSKDTMTKAGGPFIGTRGGKWADPQHKIPYNDKKHGGKPAPKAREHDEHGATELQLHIENTAGHQNQHESIRDNLAKKIAAGKYDHAQASKLFQYLADSGSKQYAKEHGSGSGHAMDVPTRQAAARQMAHEFHDEVKYGEHDHRVSSGVHAKRAKAGGGLAAMAHAHGSGASQVGRNWGNKEPVKQVGRNIGNKEPVKQAGHGWGTKEPVKVKKSIDQNLPYDDHIMSFYKG